KQEITAWPASETRHIPVTQGLTALYLRLRLCKRRLWKFALGRVVGLGIWAARHKIENNAPISSFGFDSRPIQSPRSVSRASFKEYEKHLRYAFSRKKRLPQLARELIKIARGRREIAVEMVEIGPHRYANKKAFAGYQYPHAYFRLAFQSRKTRNIPPLWHK